MDELLPPILRDNKYFMYPLFYIWFKGKYINEIMNLKSDIYSYSNSEMEDFYRKIQTMDYDRKTGLNKKSFNFIINNLHKDARKIIDIGCGRGYIVKKLSSLGYESSGCDVFKELDLGSSKYFQGNIENLPFYDKEYDVVICTHTLEHILNLNSAVSELKRIAKKQIIIVVPCQRFFYYTLDTHVNFFLKKEMLENIINMKNYICKYIQGDIAYSGNF
ncbi:MAG: class I SAM-dependent methyltransferase [Ignavibacteria bacterium]|jgi:ubiquinone/menaquinone biosynthesis C-methylase UbiE